MSVAAHTAFGFRSDADRRLALAVGALLLAGVPVRVERIGPLETKLFRAVNGLPDALYQPAWMCMQGGNLMAAPVSAAVAWRTGRPALAGRLLFAGAATWALAKVVKRVYRRPRPASLVTGTRCRGATATGLGYVSGHAGVAVALVSGAFPELPRGARLAAVLACPTIGLARMYVGAHLPLDVVGGAALGVAVDGLVARFAPKAD